MPGDVIREVAHAYAKADRAMICWTLGITEHHNAVDNVLSLINLALLTGHVGVYGSGVNPLRGQNNVQGGGDMGAIPNKLAGFQDIETGRRGAREVRGRLGRADHAEVRLDPHPDVRGDGAQASSRPPTCIGENPAIERGRQDQHTEELLTGLDTLIVQDLFMTRTAELADVVFPASNAAFESDGTVTNSERRVQRVRKALDPPGNARDDIWIIAQLANRLGAGWGDVTPHEAWEELRTLSPMHAGMSWQRLEELGGLQWPCPDEDTPGHACSCTPACGRSTIPRPRAPKAPFSIVIDEPPVDELDRGVPAAAHDRPPAGLLQHRRADRRLHVAAATRRDDRRLARGRRADAAWPRRSAWWCRAAAARSRCRCTSTTRCGRGSCS